MGRWARDEDGTSLGGLQRYLLIVGNSEAFERNPKVRITVLKVGTVTPSTRYLHCSCGSCMLPWTVSIGIELGTISRWTAARRPPFRLVRGSVADPSADMRARGKLELK